MWDINKNLYKTEIKMAKNKVIKGYDMTVGNPIVIILKYSFPLLLGSILHQFYNMADSIIVGNFVGKTALAAVGTTGVVLWMAESIFIGFSAGAMILVSQYYGANEHTKLENVINACCAITNIISIPVILIGIFSSKFLLRAMNVPADAFDQAHIYLVISFLGLAPTIGYSLNAGFLRGMGDSRSPLKFLITSTIINIILDFTFVAVFKWDVIGVAAATAIAQFIAWFYSMVFIKKHYNWLDIKPISIKCDMHIVKEMVKLGLPIGINELLFSSGVMLLQSIVNTHGSSFMAGYNVASKLDALGFMSVDALFLAVTTFVGQNIGAKKYDRVRSTVLPSIVVSSVIVETITCLLVIFGRPLMHLFTPESAVIEAGYAYLIRVMPFYAIVAAFNMLYGFMQGAGETVIPTLVNLISIWIVRLPSAYILNTTGANNIFFCYSCGWIFNLILSIILFNRNKVKRKVYGNNEYTQVNNLK